MIPLPQPSKIIKKNETESIFIIEGLYPGYGITLGNALRRVLLSSLSGAAITRVKIKDAQHEFSTLSGVMEDVITICLNLKKLRFRLHSDEAQKAMLRVQGEKEVKGNDFKLPTQLELINKDLHIAALTDKKAELEIEITVNPGIGYEPRESREKEKLEIGQISLDAIYTPIQKVSFKVEDMRVGERTDFDRLSLEIVTDGTISPEQAFIKATEILLEYFNIIIKDKEHWISETTKEKDGKDNKKEKKEKKDAITKKMKEQNIEEMGLSLRTINALSEARIKSAAGLSHKTEDDILNIEGMGPKGLKEIKKALKKLNLGLKEKEVKN